MENAPIPLVKKHLSSWGTGLVHPLRPQDDEGVLTVVLEDARHVEALVASELVGSRTMVFGPGESTGPVVGYEGSLAEPGGDLSIDDAFFLQTQDYGSAGYMSVIGATLVRIVEQGDFEAYLEDADRARAEGTFAGFVTSPAVQLADVAALGGGSAQDGPRTRLYVHADGSLSVSPWGARLGALGDGLARLEAEWHRLGRAGAAPCAVALGRVVPEAVGAAAAAERPWLGRYLAAVDALRELQARGIAEARVSGFGHRLAPALEGVDDAHDTVGTDAPMLLWTQDEAYVHIVDSRRTFKVDHAAGAAVEALLVCGSVEAAHTYADRTALLRAERLFRHVGVELAGDTLVGTGR